MISSSVESILPTKFGNFQIRAFESEFPDFPHLALYTSGIKTKEIVDVRIHSECMTGDVFSSTKCDCGDQLDHSLRWMQENEGVIIYLRQEGRGIGLINKLKAYNLQEKGLNTCEANTELGFEEDLRKYDVASDILNDLSISKIRLLTNNPDKIDSLKGFGFEIVERIKIEMIPNQTNESYLVTKKNEMGHLLELI